MIAALASTSPSVWESSGLLFSVQLMNVALRSEKSRGSVMPPTFLPTAPVNKTHHRVHVTTAARTAIEVCALAQVGRRS